MNPNPVQPFLIDVLCPGETVDRRRKAKRVVDRLLKVRRNLKNGEHEFYNTITRACDEIRAYAKLTDTQREELVLYSIEKQMASTPTEIADDTKLNLDLVKQILDKLYDDGKVYFPNRYVPLSGRQWTIIKSKRVKTPEVE